MTFEPVRCEWRAFNYGCFTAGKHSIREWVSPKAGLNFVARGKALYLPGIEVWTSSPKPVTLLAELCVI